MQDYKPAFIMLQTAIITTTTNTNRGAPKSKLNLSNFSFIRSVVWKFLISNLFLLPLYYQKLTGAALQVSLK